MEGYLLTLLLKDSGAQMNRKLCRTEAEAMAWVADQTIPPFASSWWIEAYDADGVASWSRQVK